MSDRKIKTKIINFPISHNTLVFDNILWKIKYFGINMEFGIIFRHNYGSLDEEVIDQTSKANRIADDIRKN